jgi:aspartate dehydrogenase
MKVGIIGCGAIGRVIAKAIDKKIPGLQIALVHDRERMKALKLVEELKTKPEIAEDVPEVVEGSDLTVEAASSKIVGQLLKLAMEKKKDVMVLSIGGALDHLELLERIGKEGGCRVFFPSGAIIGLDGLNAAREGKIRSVTLTTSKPPPAFAGAPYIVQHKIKLESITQPTVIFEGSSREAVKAFPRNINVSAVLSLAGVGMDKTKVRIVADPHLLKNTHKIEVQGDFGEMEVLIKNVPSPDNPKTSLLAALSAVATLKKMVSPLKIGT